MNKQLLKRSIAGLAMAISLVFTIGVISTPEVQAQSRNSRWGRDRDDRRDSWRRDRNNDDAWRRRQQIERYRALEGARARQRALEWERRNRNAYRYRVPRSYPNYDRYGSYGGYGSYGSYGSYGRYGGYGAAEEQRGYRNGLKEGIDDARDRDSFNPSRHSSFRDGNPAYRQGFARGYQQGYRQYGYSRRW